MDEMREFLWSLLFKLRALPKFIPVLAILLGTCWYILNPMGKAYISVPGDFLSFQLPRFQHCEITFQNRLPIKSYGISRIAKGANPSQETSTSVKVTKVERDVNILAIENPYNQQIEPETGPSHLYHVSVFIGPSVRTDILAVLLDDKPVDLAFFSENYLKVHGELVRFKYLRKDLADILFRLNDEVSNWVLTIIFFTVIALVGKLVAMEIRAYFYSDRHFDKYVRNIAKSEKVSKKEGSADAFDKYAAHWAQLDKRFQFLQALGPAVGFILTVSSLVEALHPALLTANDLDAFLKGIHVAMIATFVGLLLRLVALEAARVNDKLLARADTLLALPQDE